MTYDDHRADRVSGLRLWLVAIVVSVMGCSSSDRPTFPAVEGPPPDVVAASVSLARTWGSGRAVGAVTAAGRTFVVTTTGVYDATTGGTPPVPIDRFSEPMHLGDLAVAADGSELAIAFVSPPEIRRYRVDEGADVRITELDVGVEPVAVHFLPGGSLVADTTIGPFAFSSDSPHPVPLGESALAGRSAVLDDGRVVTPLVDVTELQVVGGGTTERVRLILPNGATLGEVKASLDGRSVAAAVSANTEDFDTTSSIVVLEASTFATLAVIDAGPLLEPPLWAVAAEAIAQADGGGLRLRRFDGTELASGASPVGRPIVALHEIEGGLLSLHRDGALVRWSSGSWEPTVIDAGGTAVQHAEIDPSGGLVAAVDFHGRLLVRSTSDGTLLLDDDRFASGEATDVAVSEDARIGVATSTGTLRLLDEMLNEQQQAEVLGGRTLDTLAFDPVSHDVAVGVAERVGDLAFDDTVAVWDPSDLRERYRIGGEEEDVAGCSFYYGRVRYSADGALLAATSHDFTVQILESATGRLLHQLGGDTTVLDLAFSPDGDLLVATYDDGTVVVYSTSDFQRLAHYQGAMGGYLSVAVLSDSATMAAVDITGAISLVDVMTGEAVGALEGASHRTNTLAISPDAALVAAPAADGAISLWSSGSGRQLAIVTGHTAPVTGVAFAPDGTWMVSSSSDGTVRMWTITATT